jgi:hypothetical protein
MKVTYRNTFRDRLGFAAYHLPRKPLLVLMTLAFFLVFTFQIAVPGMRTMPPATSMFVRVLTFVIFEGMLIAALLVFWTVITLLTMISTKNKPLYCERTLTVGEPGFVVESEYGRSETKWSLVQKLGRTRNHILMYLSADAAVIVPRRAFADAGQWNFFYEICKCGKEGGPGPAPVPPKLG